MPASDRRRGRPRRPAVSVVLPTWDRAPLVGRAVRSVLGQTYRDFELLVVDDGSTDGTMETLSRISDPRLHAIRLDANTGAGAARNVGIRAARGRLLAFQDSDDEWEPSKLERHLSAFEMCGPDVGVVYSDMRRIRLDGTLEYHRSPSVGPGCLIDPATGFYQVCRIGIQSAVIRRACLEAVGGFDERLPVLEDLELFIRLSQRYRFHHLQLPLVRYHETNGLSKRMSAKLVARRLMLERYRADLERCDMSFVVREARALGLSPVDGGPGRA